LSFHHFQEINVSDPSLRSGQVQRAGKGKEKKRVRKKKQNRERKTH
jgi:hypothetical protein